jgi:hypothetical protein
VITPCDVGSGWDPRLTTQPEPLVDKARRDDYRALFGMFPNLVLTAYDAATFVPDDDPLYRRLDKLALGERSAILDNVREEYREFGRLLAAEARRTGTVITVSNWEAENDWDDPESYLAYLRARLEGLARGRAEEQRASQSPQPARLLTAVEFINMPGDTVANLLYGHPPRPTGLELALDGLGPGLFDLLSYSAWRSTFHTEDIDFIRDAIRRDLALLRDQCERRGVDSSRVMIGEFGYLDSDDPTGEGFRAVAEEMLAGISPRRVAINWVLYNQPGRALVVDGTSYPREAFGKFDLQGEITRQGAAYQDLAGGAMAAA